MVRAAIVALGLLSGSGCSLILDFGDPVDVVPDAPYSQAECEYKEPNDVPMMAAMFERTETGPAAICAGDPEDRDYYRFTVPMGTTNVSVRVAFINRPSGDLDLRIIDTTGATTFGQSRGFGDVELIECPSTSGCPTLGPGDYLFEVFPATPGAVNRYDIALTLMP